MSDVADLREDYTRGALERDDLLADPIEQFRVWLEAAIADQLDEPNAMVVATVDAAGVPNARVVLLKAYDERGFVFYTNYESDKARELEGAGHAALVFNWLPHERQVRIRGPVERVSRPETAAYFHSRPKGSQLGAWASPQSRVIDGREVLEGNKVRLEREYAGIAEVPVPAHWGGYRVAPAELEFWQGRSSRLHDRFRYRQSGGAWRVERLAP